MKSSWNFKFHYNFITHAILLQKFFFLKSTLQCVMIVPTPQKFPEKASKHPRAFSLQCSLNSAAYQNKPYLLSWRETFKVFQTSPKAFHWSKKILPYIPFQFIFLSLSFLKNYSTIYHLNDPVFYFKHTHQKNSIKVLLCESLRETVKYFPNLINLPCKVEFEKLNSVFFVQSFFFLFPLCVQPDGNRDRKKFKS